MGTLSLTDPINGQPNDATTIANNNAAIKAVVNGALDNSNIASNAAIVGSKLGITYASYTPTWTATGTAPAIGNGTVNAVYAQLGKLVHAYGRITFGSTSTFGTGDYRFALPVTASAGATGIIATCGVAHLFDNSASAQGIGVARLITSTTVDFEFGATYLGTVAGMGQLTPWTWATSDIVAWSITYEAA